MSWNRLCPISCALFKARDWSSFETVFKYGLYGSMSRDFITKHKSFFLIHVSIIVGSSFFFKYPKTLWIWRGALSMRILCKMNVMCVRQERHKHILLRKWKSNSSVINSIVVDWIFFFFPRKERYVYEIFDPSTCVLHYSIGSYHIRIQTLRATTKTRNLNFCSAIILKTKSSLLTCDITCL